MAKKNGKQKLSLTDELRGNGSQERETPPLSQRQEKATLQERAKAEEKRPRANKNETSTPPNVLQPAVNLEFALQTASFASLVVHKEDQ